MRPFGSIAYVGIPRQRRQGTLGPRARWDILIGYAFRTKGYCIWVPKLNQIIESIDVTFDEKAKFDPEHSGAVMGLKVGELSPVMSQNDQVVEDLRPSQVSPTSRQIHSPIGKRILIPRLVMIVSLQLFLLYKKLVCYVNLYPEKWRRGLTFTILKRINLIPSDL